jgi:hypothetical protein
MQEITAHAKFTNLEGWAVLAPSPFPRDFDIFTSHPFALKTAARPFAKSSQTLLGLNVL